MKPVQSSVKRRSIFVNRFIFKRVKNELGQRNKKINHFITGIVFTHLLFGALRFFNFRAIYFFLILQPTFFHRVIFWRGGFLSRHRWISSPRIITRISFDLKWHDIVIAEIAKIVKIVVNTIKRAGITWLRKVHLDLELII